MFYGPSCGPFSGNRCPGAHRLAPSPRVAHRRRRIDSSTPPWVMSDPELRTQLLDRHQRLLETNGGGSLHEAGSTCTSTTPPCQRSWRRRSSARACSAFRSCTRSSTPIWTAFLYVTPPELHPRHAPVGLIRSYLARRFPDLGFERQRKLNANAFFTETLLREGPEIWRELGGARALAALGVVDPVELDRALAAYLRAPGVPGVLPDLVRAEPGGGHVRELA